MIHLEVVGGFQEHDGFTQQWWDHHSRYFLDNRVFLEAIHDGGVVARVELDQKVDPGHYVGAPPLGDYLLEIQFIEVHAAHRLRGLGTAVVEALARDYPSRRLVAFSEGADGFWASLGWTRHLHRSDREPSPRYRPLYVQV